MTCELEDDDLTTQRTLFSAQNSTHTCTSTLFLADCSILTPGPLALMTPFAFSGQGIVGYRWDTQCNFSRMLHRSVNSTGTTQTGDPVGGV